MSAFETDIRKGMDRAYRLGVARAYAAQARQLLNRQLAYDQAQGGPEPEARMRQVVNYLKSKLSPEEFETAMRLLRGEELNPEDWDANDSESEGGLPRNAIEGGLRGRDTAFRRSMPRHAMDERSRLAFDAQFPQAKRLDGPPVLASTSTDRMREQEFLRRRRDRRDGGLAFDTKSKSEASDRFFQMFPQSRRLS